MMMHKHLTFNWVVLLIVASGCSGLPTLANATIPYTRFTARAVADNHLKNSLKD
jgi:hypothetical protein